jgi:hypothetical protein
MINGISNSVSSIADSLETISGDLQNPQQSSGGQGQGPEASGGASLEEEIKDSLVALTQELAQLTALLGASQGAPQIGGDGQGGGPAASSGGSSPSHFSPKVLTAEPGP